MGSSKLINTFGSIPFRTERSANCAKLRLRRSFAIVLAAFTALTFVLSPAFADVQSTGSVDPARNPFDPVTFPGLPGSGNLITSSTPTAAAQPSFEGVQDVIVGKTSFGEVLISGNTALRYEDLILGDKGTINNQTRFGTGVMRISGFGAVYNNDPVLLPFGLDYASFGSKRDVQSGFDVIVGRYGTGILDVSAGGRVEIQDAFLVGDNPGAVGNVIVDGIDSFIGTSAFNSNAGGGQGSSGNKSIYHGTLIGRQGVGTMTISSAAGTGGTGTVAGATVDSEASPNPNNASTANVGPVAAVLGSTPYTLTAGQVPDPGGSGAVNVTGVGSKWILGGTLQIGGFDIGLNGQTIGDIEGDNTLYGNQVGQGTLNVSDGGQIIIHSAPNVAQDDVTTSLLLAIGRFGTVQLDNGTITMGNVIGGTQQAKSDAIAVINDGIIRGGGRIDTAAFRNRYFGQVRVDAGQKLVIHAAADFNTTTSPTPPTPLLNFGLMEVIGTSQSRAELEFQRINVSTNPSPFTNSIVFPPNPPSSLEKFSGGVINVQWGTLRSSSGTRNESIVAFTAGDNIIQGQFKNVVGSTGFVPKLRVGPNTTVVAYDDVSAVVTPIGVGNTFTVLDPGTLTSAGVMDLPLSLNHPNLIAAAGDIAISGVIILDLQSDVIADLQAHGPSQTYRFISFGGQAYGTKKDADGSYSPDYSKVIPDCTGNPFCAVPGLGVVSPNLATLLGPSFNNVFPVAERLGNEIRIGFLNPFGGGAIAPDFNGDHFVDNADFLIWKANNGITSGATIIQGDADGDGDVDGADFLKWQRNAGKPMPWTGAGSGSEDLGAVPEPTSVAILFSAMSLVLATSRRRRCR